MPITASAKKAMRQSARRRVKNLVRIRAYKKALKDARSLVKTGAIDEAKKSLPHLQKALDKAAKTGVIKKNKASRLMSRAASAIAAKKS